MTENFAVTRDYRVWLPKKVVADLTARDDSSLDDLVSTITRVFDSGDFGTLYLVVRPGGERNDLEWTTYEDVGNYDANHGAVCEYTVEDYTCEEIDVRID